MERLLHHTPKAYSPRPKSSHPELLQCDALNSLGLGLAAASNSDNSHVVCQIRVQDAPKENMQYQFVGSITGHTEDISGNTM